MAVVVDRTAYATEISESQGRQPAPPAHIAIVMDGNGRWAQQRGLPRVAGHRHGVDSVRKVVSACIQHHIPNLTLFAFSSENWRRPAREVQLLMELFANILDKELKALDARGVRLRFIGDTDGMSESIRSRIQSAKAMTARNHKLQLTIALNYGGHWDITQACRQMAKRVDKDQLRVADLSVETFEKYLATDGLPAPNLLIRTGGDQRISNFLLWQLAYTELYFTDTLWPSFNQCVLQRILDDYTRRQPYFVQPSDSTQTLCHA